MAETLISFALEMLMKEVTTMITKALIFKDELKRINRKLRALDPLIKKMEEMNKKLDLSQSNIKDIQALMEEGKQLVAKCESNCKRWSKRSAHVDKLRELDESLGELLEIIVFQLNVDNLEVLELVREILAEMKRNQNATLSTQTQMVSGGFAVPQPPRFVVGFDAPLRELKMELLKEDSSVLVLTAPPGYGKTTLAQKLCKDDEIKEKFGSNIMFVEVPERANLNLVVQDLNQYNCSLKPDVQNGKAALKSLEQLLRRMGPDPVLLVLDDLWSKLEFNMEDLSSENIPEYKILVTSRYEFPSFGPTYELKTLDNEDAIRLFRFYAKLDDQNSDISDDLVKEVVQSCKRVPLALKLIGSSLCGRKREIWRRELRKWRKWDSSILDFMDELLLCLKRSLDLLVEEDATLKECFLDLGSFPEDRRIPVTALIDIWTELHELEEDDATAYLFDLGGANMADVVVTRKDVYEEDDYYSEHFVTQHDMLRELALQQSRQDPETQRKRLNLELTGKNLPAWWNARNELTFDARLVSITTDDKFSSKWCNILKLPEAEVLILNFLSENYALPDFLKTMTQLKVLIITNRGPSLAKISNFELLGSFSNLKRIRFERVAIPSLSKTSIMWENLQKLSFFMCKVSEAFGYIQESGPFPNLQELNIDYCADLVELPAGFCQMVKDVLVKLSITHCHKLSRLPEEIGKMNNLKVLRFRSCIGLEHLPDSICRLHRLAFLDLSDCFSIRNLPEDIGDLCSLKKLNIKGCARLQGLPESILEFKQLKDVVCDEELKELWESSLTYYSEVEIKFSISTVNLKLAKEDINLNWNMYS